MYMYMHLYLFICKINLYMVARRWRGSGGRMRWSGQNRGASLPTRLVRIAALKESIKREWRKDSQELRVSWSRECASSILMMWSDRRWSGSGGRMRWSEQSRGASPTTRVVRITAYLIE